MTNLRSLALFGVGIVLVLLPTLWALGVFDSRTQELRISSGGTGGTYRAFADVMAAALGSEDGLSLSVMGSAGADENAERLATDAADIGLIQSDTTLEPNTLVMARLFPEAFHLVARIGSDIQSVSDLAGKRIGLPPEGAGSNALFSRLLRHYEVPFSSLEVSRGSLSDHAAAIEVGDIDAFFMVIALGNATIEGIIEATPTQLVPIDQAEAIAMFDPALSATIVPMGTYSGERPVPAEPMPAVTVHSLLAVRSALPDATVDALTRALFENRQRMVRDIPQAAFLTAPSADDRLAFGVHPGADLYYSQDDPLFIVEYAEPLALGVTALALLVSVLWQGRIWLSGARKNRADQYNLAIIDIIDRAEAATSHDEFGRIRRELFEILEKVIVDLDNDRIEERSLVSFSFAWQVASSTLNHRQLVVSSNDPGGVKVATSVERPDGAPEFIERHA